MAKKMDETKKTKLVYSGELAFFAVAFLVLGILLLTNVLHPNNLVLRQIFVYVSLAGGAWAIADFFWCLFSPKRKAKNSMIDKALLLPVAISIIVIDIITLVKGFEETLDFHRIAVGALFLYIAIDYAFQAIYHYYKPVPLLLKAIEEAEAEKKKEKELLLDQQNSEIAPKEEDLLPKEEPIEKDQ